MLLGNMSSSKSDINLKKTFSMGRNASNVERHVAQITCEGHACYKIMMNKREITLILCLFSYLKYYHGW